MNEKAKRNVEKIKELILPLEKKNQQMILLCVANISMGSRVENDDYSKTVEKLTRNEVNDLIEREADPFTLVIHHLMQEVFKDAEEDEEN